MLTVKKTKDAGRGVFATQDILSGTKILCDHVVVIKMSDMWLIDKTILGHYVFQWGKGAAMSLGLSSLVNHSYEPNAEFEIDRRKKTVSVITLEDIKAGHEIRMNYGCNPQFSLIS